MKRLVFILIFTLIVGSAVALLSWFAMQNVYQTSSTIIVSSQKNKQDLSEITNNDYTLNVNLVNSYQVLCKTDRVLSQVIKETGLPLTVDELRPKINVSSKTDTEIISIAVKDNNPEVAQRIANSLADVFQKEVVNIMKMDNVQIIDYASLPIEPIAPNRVLNVLLATIAGFMVGVGISILLEYLDTTIKSTEQVEAIIEAPVLGWIPHIE
jgi:capsular polysaccharide biosynthesis protein